MSQQPPASIIISSYNYGRYLRQAIDSALNQTAGPCQVIVVDDGSTDDSPEIIRSYGDRVLPILKSNAGQASSFNAGFSVAQASIIIFLDSDDVLLPTCVERVTTAMARDAAPKVHWPMSIIDADGRPTGRFVPDQTLSEGDLRPAILRDGPEAYSWPPTSGNAWSREFLSRVMPIPPQVYQVCPDLYLAALAPMHGPLHRIDPPQSCWRIHGKNQTWSLPFEKRLDRLIWRWDVACDALIAHCCQQRLAVDRRRWISMAWCHRVKAAIDDICAVVPPGESFVLIDGNEWGTDEWLRGRRRIAFMQRHGQFWGLPASDDEALAELERRRRQGVGFVVLAWGSFWWRQMYAQFIGGLESRFPLLLCNDRVIIYDLRESTRQASTCAQPASTCD
ncbi:glycosyltransferase family 2 protein [Fontivita pretiosa]|uniref:glycosyltransferase family 2 protein n=1 Tax=Fontivita pretiosa TaxID=2989684 RepID=UPI003D16763C